MFLSAGRNYIIFLYNFFTRTPRQRVSAASCPRFSERRVVRVLVIVRVTTVIGVVARAINLFKCYSEIISEHDRVPREFKFGRARSIFRSNVPQMVSSVVHTRARARAGVAEETRGTVARYIIMVISGISGTRAAAAAAE